METSPREAPVGQASQMVVEVVSVADTLPSILALATRPSTSSIQVGGAFVDLQDSMFPLDNILEDATF